MKRIQTVHPLSPSIREAVGPLLQTGVVLGIDLERQAKQAHWTLRGPTFIALHELFDEVAESAVGFTDLAAERLMGLGGVADGTVKTVAGTTTLPTFPVGLMGPERQIELVRQTLGAYSAFLYEAIRKSADLGDPTTSDVFTEISRDLDQLLWKVEAHLPVKETGAK